MIPETSAQGTLMLRECVENADTSKFKCENKLGDQGTVSFFSPHIILMLCVSSAVLRIVWGNTQSMNMVCVFPQTHTQCVFEDTQTTRRPVWYHTWTLNADAIEFKCETKQSVQNKVVFKCSCFMCFLRRFASVSVREISAMPTSRQRGTIQVLLEKWKQLICNKCLVFT